jgi:benzoyl-CoA reductase/2-hydroxyglutaryl-CoA dehydratase subunit BcrC/BadD/HgdB
MRVITEEKLQLALFAELQSIAVKRKSAHVGGYKNWCLTGEDVEQAIRNIFAVDGIFRMTMDIDRVI